MNKDLLYAFIKEQDQQHLIPILDKASLPQKKRILKQIEIIASKPYQKLQTSSVAKMISPIEKMPFSGSQQEIELGLQTLMQNQTGCLIFAGGQATRLNTNRAKGLFPIQGKSLFAQICMWISAYNLAFNLSIPLIVLVSKQNKKQIQRHFENNRCFGLCPKKIMLLEQGEYPLFDEDQKWVLKRGKIYQAANGNGGVFEALQKKRAKQFLKDHRLQYLHMVPIDNPLNDPLDINLLGYLQAQKLDVVIKAFLSKDPNEKAGRIYQDQQKHLIVDYMELSKEKKKQLIYANGGHYCIKLSSLFELEEKKVTLPYHFVKKKIDTNLWGWKGEKFVFDLFPYFSKVSSLCYEKKQFFAPLKEPKDLGFIERSLERKKRGILEKINRSNIKGLTEKELEIYLKKDVFTVSFLALFLRSQHPFV